MISLCDISFGDRKMMERIWEGNHAEDRAFATLTTIGRKGVKKNMRIRGLSILVALLAIAAAFPSVLAGSDVVTQTSDEAGDYGSCSTCSSGCCTDCSEAAELVVLYAWEHVPTFPKVTWLQPYPVITYVSDLTRWAASFAVELHHGFQDTCYQPLFIVSEVVIAATQYALKEVLQMLHRVVFIFLPAILAVAFLKAVVYYLKQICDGSTVPDNSTPLIDSVIAQATNLESSISSTHQPAISSSILYDDTITTEE
jgi:hypothetical protein